MPDMTIECASETQARAVAAVVAERARQDQRWGAAHDDLHDAGDWYQILHGYVGDLLPIEPTHASDVLTKIAAVAIAAMESWDRKAARLAEEQRLRGEG
jgi:hypothetical protein